MEKDGNRMNLYEKEVENIKSLMNDNEKAMTKMDELMLAMNHMESDEKQAKLDMGASMKELEAWTQKVKLYK